MDLFRYKNNFGGWSRASFHVGPMSEGERQIRPGIRPRKVFNRETFLSQHVRAPIPFAAEDKAVDFATNFQREAKQWEGCFSCTELERHVSVVGPGVQFVIGRYLDILEAGSAMLSMVFKPACSLQHARWPHKATVLRSGSKGRRGRSPGKKMEPGCL